MTLLSHALGIYSPPHQKYKVVFFAYKTAFSRKKKNSESSIFCIESDPYLPDQDPYLMWLCQMSICHVDWAI